MALERGEEAKAFVDQLLHLGGPVPDVFDAL